MADELNVGGAEQTAEQENIITREEAEKMVQDAVKAAIEETSGKLNSTFQSKFAEIKKEKDDLVKSKMTEEEKLQERLIALENRANEAERKESLANNRSLATQMLIDADLRVPRTLDRLIGKDEEETKAIIQAYIEDRQDDNASVKDQEAKKYGRKVVDTTQKTVEKMSYEDMVKLSDEQFNAIPKDLVIKAMDLALKE